MISLKGPRNEKFLKTVWKRILKKIRRNTKYSSPILHLSQFLFHIQAVSQLVEALRYKTEGGWSLGIFN